MTEEEPQLKNLINDCEQGFSCPLYSAFWDKPNAQSQFRRDHFKWSNKYKPKLFKIGEEVFGAKLALIMESPPPTYLEYFYGSQGGFEKDKSLFKNLIFTLARLENKRDNLELEKDTWLKWFADLGIVIIDAAKCRMQISDAFEAEKINPSKIRGSFNSCSNILKLQLKILNPFRVAIGIASVYDNDAYDNIPYVKEILGELGNENAFIDNRTVSLWYDREAFLEWFAETWLKIKNELMIYGIN